MVIFDTNIIIDHIRQIPGKDPPFKKHLRENPDENFAISVISIQELYEGKSTKNESADKILLATISPLKVFKYDYDTAQLAGEIARDSKAPIDFADAAIAATSILNNARLYTLDKKDFSGIKELQLY